jgi:hypothetical protein
MPTGKYDECNVCLFVALAMSRFQGNSCTCQTAATDCALLPQAGVHVSLYITRSFWLVMNLAELSDGPTLYVWCQEQSI